MTRLGLRMEFTATRRWRYRAAALIYAALSCALILLAVDLWDRATQFLAITLEHRFSRPAGGPPDEITGIIALGGLHQRVVEAVHLARQYPEGKLVVTGAPSEDEAYVQAQGLAHDRVLLETRAKTTFENAVFSQKLLAPARHDKWLLVTSAIHMPRAIGVFRKAGFSVVPWPVSSVGKDKPTAWTTLHEVFGLLEYRLLGRIDSFFPAPNS
jgi:uncharacterized SAM-binding protein YcdF (DUF218 family)